MSVRCAECGYLGIRLKSNRQLVEADETLRKAGGLTRVTHAVDLLDEHPICFARFVDFCEEMAPHPDNNQRLHHLRKDRDCPHFVKWQPGLSPKEHFDMQLVQEQREWNRNAAKADQMWREAQAQREHEWRLQESRTATRRFWIGGVAMVILAAVIGLVGSILGALIAAGRL